MEAFQGWCVASRAEGIHRAEHPLILPSPIGPLRQFQYDYFAQEGLEYQRLLGSVAVVVVSRSLRLARFASFLSFLGTHIHYHLQDVIQWQPGFRGRT